MEARGKAVRGVVKALALSLAFPLTCRSRATSRDMLVTRVAPAEQTGALATVDCKTVRIFAYSITREQSNKRSGMMLKTESETSRA